MVRLSAALLTGWLSSAAFAEPLLRFDIDARPLPQALSEFSRLTGQNVIYTDEAAYGQQAPALHGRYSADSALQRLLERSGLVWRRADARTVTVEAPAKALNLGAITVDASRNAGATYRQPALAGISRSAAPTREIPQAINVVPQQVLEDQKPRNLDDALRNVSGLIQGNTLGSTQDTLVKRGFGENRDGSIMRDGMPVVQGRNLNATAERVEVLKGPASVLYGIQDPGGVLNVVAKQPQLTPYNALGWRGSSYGSGKNGNAGTLDSTGALGEAGLAYRLILDHQDEDYWRNFGTHRETLVAPSLAWYGEAMQVQLAYEHREFRYPFDRGTAIDPRTNHPLDIPATRRLDEPFNDMRGRSDLYHAQVDHALSDSWNVHLGFSYNRETYDASQVRVTAVDPATGTLARSMDGTRGALATDRFSTVSLAGERSLFGLRHELLLGVDDEYRKVYRADLIRQSSLTTFSYVNPVYGQEVEGTTASAADSNQSDTLRTQSVFGQDAIHLDDQWILVAGVRFQRYDQLAGKGWPFTVNTDTHGQAWVPRGGVVYQFNDELALYASYSESFKPNSSVATLVGGTVIDSGLQPEQARAWELGAKFDLGGALTGNVALFDIRKRNVLVASYDSVTTNTAYSTAGQVRSRGLEVDVSGPLSERWSLIGNYAFTDAWVAKDPDYQGNRLQNAARHSGGVNAVYDWGAVLGNDRLRLGLGAHYVGERAGNAQNDFNLPAYTVADAFASYQTLFEGQKLRLALNLNNVFDRVYYTSAVSRYFVSMGDSRQLVLSSTLEF
jgi:iron complex outermembrane receptor protein